MTGPHARRVLVFLVLLAVVLTAAIALPLWKPLFLAAVLAAALSPLTERLAVRLRGHRGIAAAILTVGLLVVVLIPVGGLATVIVRQVVQGIQWLRDTLQSEGVSGIIERLPDVAQGAAREMVDSVPQLQQELRRLAGQQGGQAAAKLGGFLAATGTLLFQTAMMIVAFFLLLVDGGKLIDWIDEQLPLPAGQLRALMKDFRRTSVSVLLSTLGTAAVQSAVALVGYLIARVPSPLFLTLVTFVVALIPAVGASLVAVAVGLLLLATDHVFAGAFLTIWGIAVVSVSDNVVRPYLLKGGMELNGGLVFFSLVGALAAFGGIGIVVGPLVITFLVSVLKLYHREFPVGEGEGDHPSP
jgi:predicted PurR-regulated permease PerM